MGYSNERKENQYILKLKECEGVEREVNAVTWSRIQKTGTGLERYLKGVSQGNMRGQNRDIML